VAERLGQVKEEYGVQGLFSLQTGEVLSGIFTGHFCGALEVPIITTTILPVPIILCRSVLGPIMHLTLL